MRQPHRETLQDNGFGRFVGVGDGTPIELAPGAGVARIVGHHRDGGFERDFGENIRYRIAIDLRGCFEFIVFHEISAPFPRIWTARKFRWGAPATFVPRATRNLQLPRRDRNPHSPDNTLIWCTNTTI